MYNGSYSHLISIMGFATLVRQHLYIESDPGSQYLGSTEVITVPPDVLVPNTSMQSNRNILWLRDTVKQTFQGKSAAGGPRHIRKTK